MIAEAQFQKEIQLIIENAIREDVGDGDHRQRARPIHTLTQATVHTMRAVLFFWFAFSRQNQTQTQTRYTAPLHTLSKLGYTQPLLCIYNVHLWAPQAGMHVHNQLQTLVRGQPLIC